MLKALKTKKRRKGFTLIEMVVVVAIIGILATVVIPQFASITKDAEDKVNIASARTIESAINLALLEKDTLNSDDINKYLSNIEVKICDGEVGHDHSEIWCVTLKSNDVFDIRKEGVSVFKSDEDK